MKQTDLAELIRGMDPRLNPGEYVFVSVQDLTGIERGQALCEFREAEGTTLVLERRKADELKLNYEFIASWITLQVHSALEAVGLTAACSGELARHKMSCNVLAGYYHDHIFVKSSDAPRALQVLRGLSEKQR